MIPNVSFLSKKLNTAIEIIDLLSIQTRQLSHDPEAPHRVQFYMLIQIDKGCGEHFIDFQKYPFQKNSLIFINKHQIHAFDFSHPLEGKVILFTDEFIGQVQTNMRLPLFSPFYLASNWQPVFTPEPDLQKHCKTLIGEAEQELLHRDSQPMIVMLIFSALLLMVMREKSFSQRNVKQSHLLTFQHFGELLEKRFTYTRDANSYAAWLNITYKTLNAICKKVSNHTAKQVIDHYTVMEAKRRLILSSEASQQLAYDLGFDEPTNFVKYFKKHTGVTPSHFRTQN